MSTHHGTETDFELTTIKRLETLKYQHVFGMDIERSQDEVVLKDILRQSLAIRYKDLPSAALDEAIHIITRPDGVDTLRRNLAFHQLLTRGFDLKVEFPGGKTEYRHIYPVNWDEPAKNDFRVINQFPIHGQNDRRPPRDDQHFAGAGFAHGQAGFGHPACHAAGGFSWFVVKPWTMLTG